MNNRYLNYELIIDYMFEHDLSFNEFCKQSGVDIIEIKKIFDDDFNMDLNYVNKVANFMNIDPKKFLVFL